eukprot:6207635-Pleurochrysis_carterae.AAC.2
MQRGRTLSIFGSGPLRPAGAESGGGKTERGKLGTRPLERAHAGVWTRRARVSVQASLLLSRMLVEPRRATSAVTSEENALKRGERSPKSLKARSSCRSRSIPHRTPKPHTRTLAHRSAFRRRRCLRSTRTAATQQRVHARAVTNARVSRLLQNVNLHERKAANWHGMVFPVDEQ